MSLESILDMGKYAGYVWSCFVLTALVLIGNAWLARRSLAGELVRARRRRSAGNKEVS